MTKPAAQGRVKRQINRLPPEKRIADIMAAAREVFTERGYNDALISEIAERAGVVEGSIYRFFVNKRDLLVRVVEHFYEEMLARDEAQFDAIEGTRNRLRYIIHEHVSSIRREPGLSRLFLLQLRADPDYRASRLFKLNQAYTQRILDVVRDGIASGEFRADVSPSLVRDMIYGGIEHRTWGYLRNEKDFDLAATVDGITDMIYRALAAAPDAAPEEDRLAKAAARLEKAADRLERLASGRGGVTA
ncbi:MAG: TetR/AcrR family transcriptional regulator [Alphaproteobacteria bacterium]|nr:TetR/AcrR family transcriptional regulator [Alphaproteobacteria bacterium]MDX5463830.1 TetR/AcrR family transcriptional regulator [Alphaproteobacteria bacterium]